MVCILPAFNEQGKIGRVVSKVAATGQVTEIVVVDDCSTDATSADATAAGATVLRHEVNQGVGAGIRTGLKYGRQHQFEAAVILSGDDQHEPQELGRVLKALAADRDRFVQGSRRLRGGKTVNGPLFREVTTRLYSLLFSFLTGQWITDATNGFRAFYLELLDDPAFNLDQDWLRTYELEPYLLFTAVKSRRWTVVEVPITIYYHGDRVQYTKMKPFRDWWRLARPLIFLKLRLRR